MQPSPIGLLAHCSPASARDLAVRPEADLAFCRVDQADQAEELRFMVGLSWSWQRAETGARYPVGIFTFE
eukprot:5416911-Pyramimonas_sp.AAC.1